MSEVRIVKSTETFGNNVRVDFTEFRDERGALECPIEISGTEVIHGSQREDFIRDFRALIDKYGGI